MTINIEHLFMCFFAIFNSIFMPFGHLLIGFLPVLLLSFENSLCILDTLGIIYVACKYFLWRNMTRAIFFFFFVLTESFAEQKFQFDEVSLISFSFYEHYFFGVRSKTFPSPRLQRFSIFFLIVLQFTFQSL